ncbi:hypothetical protein Tco_0887130 [Tanacetum coccineum]
MKNAQLIRLFSLSRLEGYGRETEGLVFGTGATMGSKTGSGPTGGWTGAVLCEQEGCTWSFVTSGIGFTTEEVGIGRSLICNTASFPPLFWFKLLSVLVKVIPPIEIVSIIRLGVLYGWKTGRCEEWELEQKLGSSCLVHARTIFLKFCNVR